MATKARVTFLHPDLGLGGAERLIVDSAVGLQQKGYNVTVITGYHDPNRAFPETVNGTLKVIRVGSWIPRSIFGRFVALCAYFKMTYAAFYLNLISGLYPQVVICDQVSACIPFLRLTLKPFTPLPRVLFYCHFPDQLLTDRKSFLKSLYRGPLDWFEEFTTGLADKVVVNSQFTRKVFQDTFRKISVVPDILYPSINSKLFDEFIENGNESEVDLTHAKYMFLSLNRFERKKNIALAIKSLNKLKTCLEPEEWKEVHLVLAGGYDERLEDSVNYLALLKKICTDEKVESHVSFILSPKDSAKVALLNNCTALVYTPANEHFGIVPLEAMYLGKPVIAANSGGPLETVVDNETGFLCPPIETHFAVSMARFIKDENLVKSFGKAGKERFVRQFSFEAFSANWARAVESVLKS